MDAQNAEEGKLFNIPILMLAAGGSTRMGKSKQLLPFAGETLLTHAIRVALQSNASSHLVVLGANAQQHLQLLAPLNTSYTVNVDWQQGMGSSIQAGLKHLLMLNAQIDGVLITLADQPAITPKHLNDLLDAFSKNEKQIVASEYGNTIGVPAVFSALYFPHLLTIEKEGAKRVMLKHPEAVMALPFPEGAIDIDTPEDYRELLRRSKNR